MLSYFMRALLVAAVLISAAGGVYADEKAQAREHYFKGTKAFDLGAYDEAITEYSAAYRAKDDPALLYNIAQAHRLAGHPTEALRFYRTFLSKVPSAPNRPEVEAKIAELQKLIEQQKRTETIPPSDVKPLTPSHDQQSEPKETAAPATVEVSPPAPQAPEPPKPSSSDSHPGRTKKVAGLAVGAAGLALVAAGVGLSVAAQQAMISPRSRRAEERSIRARRRLGRPIQSSALSFSVLVLRPSWRELSSGCSVFEKPSVLTLRDRAPDVWRSDSDGPTVGVCSVDGRRLFLAEI